MTCPFSPDTLSSLTILRASMRPSSTSRYRRDTSRSRRRDSSDTSGARRRTRFQRGRSVPGVMGGRSQEWSTRFLSSPTTMRVEKRLKTRLLRRLQRFWNVKRTVGSGTTFWTTGTPRSKRRPLSSARTPSHGASTKDSSARSLSRLRDERATCVVAWSMKTGESVVLPCLLGVLTHRSGLRRTGKAGSSLQLASSATLHNIYLTNH